MMRLHRENRQILESRASGQSRRNIRSGKPAKYSFAAYPKAARSSVDCFQEAMPVRNCPYHLGGRRTARLGRNQYLWPNEKLLLNGDRANPGTEVTDDGDAFVDSSDCRRTWLTY